MLQLTRPSHYLLLSTRPAGRVAELGSLGLLEFSAMSYTLSSPLVGESGACFLRAWRLGVTDSESFTPLRADPTGGKPNNALQPTAACWSTSTRFASRPPWRSFGRQAARTLCATTSN